MFKLVEIFNDGRERPIFRVGYNDRQEAEKAAGDFLSHFRQYEDSFAARGFNYPERSRVKEVVVREA